MLGRGHGGCVESTEVVGGDSLERIRWDCRDRVLPVLDAPGLMLSLSSFLLDLGLRFDPFPLLCTCVACWDGRLPYRT